MLARSFGLLGRAGFMRDELIKKIEATQKRRDGVSPLVESFKMQRAMESDLRYGDTVKMSKIVNPASYWEYLPGYKKWLREQRGVESEKEHGEALKRLTMKS